MYYSRKFDGSIIEVYHSVKADYMQSLSLIMRAVFKEGRSDSEFYYSRHPILEGEELVGMLVEALRGLNRACLHYQIRSPGLIKLI